MNLAAVRKFLVAALTALGIVLAVLLASGVEVKWLTIALACVNAIGVYLVPNAYRVVRPPVTKTTGTPATPTA